MSLLAKRNAQELGLIANIEAQKLFKRLPLEERVLVILRRVYGFTLRELAYVFGMTVSAMQSRWKRLRVIMKRMAANPRHRLDRGGVYLKLRVS